MRCNTVTESMVAATVRTVDGARALRVERVLRPQPQVGQVRVRVQRAGINTLDARLAEGTLPRWATANCLPWDLSSAPTRGIGVDVVGIVDRVGSEAHAHLLGCRVAGYVNASRRACFGFATPGTYAEWALASASDLAVVPSVVSDDEAAALPLPALTAHQVLEKYSVGAKHRVVVMGAAGSVGKMAVQLSMLRGARVSAVCRPKDADAVAKLGADEVIVADDVRRLVPTPVYDVVYDTTAALSAKQGGRWRRRGGVFVSNLFSADVAWRRWTGLADFAWVKPNGAHMKHLLQLVAAGQLRVEVDATFLLEQVAQAHQWLADRGGRVVLEVQPALPGAFPERT